MKENLKIVFFKNFTKTMGEVVKATAKHNEEIVELNKLLKTKKVVLKALRQDLDEV